MISSHRTLPRAISVPVICLASCLISISGAQAVSARRARAELLKGDHRRAVLLYSRNRLSEDPEIAGEYAYSLALAGLKDLALGHLDQALSLQANSQLRSGTVNFYAAEVFRIFGHADIAEEISRQAVKPRWLTAEPKKPRDSPDAGRKTGSDFGADLALANLLMMQKRYYTAADRLSGLVVAHPNEPLGYSTFAIALEKIGAYRKAARAVGRALELQKNLNDKQRAIYEEHRKELDARPQQAPPPRTWRRQADMSLKGRYLAFLGGNIHRTKTNTVSKVDGRLGKFFTDRFDASLTAGYTAGNLPDDYRGASGGLSGRYHQPLPIRAPVNVTFGSRLQYNPRPKDKFSVIVSPGVSWVLEGGSIDFFLDYGVSGPLKKTKTISLGYTVYFKVR